MSAIDTFALWGRMPPAVFPSIMGLFGLGLAWRSADEVLGFGMKIGPAILWLASLIYLCALGLYVAKFSTRPGVIVEDMQALPGRAGLAVMSLNVLLLAAALASTAHGPANLVLFVGLAGHVAIAALISRVLGGFIHTQRQLNPTWHLTYVGFIVAPRRAPPSTATLFRKQ